MATAALSLSHNDYFFQQLSRNSRSVLALDYDRTIGQLGSVRKRRFPAVSVRVVLSSILATTDTQVVLVSRHGTPHPIPRTRIATLQQEDRTVQVEMHTLCEPVGNSSAALAEFFSRISKGAPLAYITTPASGDVATARTRDPRLMIRPQFFVRDAKSWSGEKQDILQFLIDWVRACGGELC